MKRKIFLLVLLLIGTWVVRAEEPVRFTASTSSPVEMDKPFQLVYSVNASGRDLRVPEIKQFDILAGPFESHSSSMQIINGRRSSSVTVSYTYTLQAQRTGTFTIPSASIMVDNQKYTSNGLSVKVLPSDDNSSTSNSKSGKSGSSASQNISNDNIFIRTNVSKTSVHEQEGVLVTYKLYTLADVVQCINKKMPDFNGFMKQDIDQLQNKQFSYENYKGRNYGTVVLYQVLLFPQRSGVIQISKANFEAVIRVQNRAGARSVFDDFFDSYTNVSKNITAPGTRISVTALPSNKPTSFNGTVGRFSMNSSLSGNQFKANEAVTLKIKIAGSGNLKLIKNPEIKFPEGFEVYDPKVNNNFKSSAAGVSGTKTIEYMFIPRHSGDFVIPLGEFSYFDIQSKTYKTLRTPVYKLHVQKGEAGDNSTSVGTYTDKEDLKQLGKDIRYIQTGTFELKKEEEPLFGTPSSWLMFLTPLLLSLFLFVFFRKQAKENANINLLKNRKANKLAQKRLKFALKLLKEGNKDKFYEEVLKAVWTYLSDKLSLPVANLTKDNVESELLKQGVDSSTINQFLQILNTCEFARYAPNSGQQEMGNLYSETIDAISQLEQLNKKS